MLLIRDMSSTSRGVMIVQLSCRAFMAQLQALLWKSHSALELITSTVQMQLTGAEAQTSLRCLPTGIPVTAPLQTCSHSMAC